ncbi:hypothetical protein G4B88_026128 [Cannabis sativa]|uniref:50S ribosomal protein L35 n=1 Tax=Cannabis sativa TaxID=3483 RepID=A0A7J6DQ01_CANSA|nr:hypothetical protein G4B88_026128 [Cannabis sativa]
MEAVGDRDLGVGRPQERPGVRDPVEDLGLDSPSVRLAPFHKANSLKLSSWQTISGFNSVLTQKLSAVTPSPNSPRSLTVAAKGYKIKTHKASAKRFRVTGRGKIVRRRAEI